MEKNCYLYTIKAISVIFVMLIISIFAQISNNVVLYDELGINPKGSENIFIGYALILSFIGLLICLVSYYFYKKNLAIK